MSGPVLVRDISVPDTDTEFRSDVQLSTFYENRELNHDLTRRFMFTRGSGGREERRGTAELLDLLRQTATSPALDNRFVFMATYGHGKSHFGLAAANYFGQPQDSPELDTVLGKLEHVLPADRAAMFRQYREHTAPFLVVILRGDKPGSLRDGFFRALDEALAQHEATRNVKPPFWFAEAEKALERIAENADAAERAEKFLAKRNLDLFSLRDMVKGRESGAYTPAVDVFRAVYGVAPDFGAETALNEAVGWAANTLCGPGKPFGGLLILFDEFSMFVRDYLTNNPTGAPFQDLMNGVSNHRSKALFVGLSQHDPNVLAERGGPAAADLLKELNRIPQPNRQRMQTMLEDVLGAYFRTDEAAWAQFMAQRPVATRVADASELAYTLYKRRYGPGQMGWNFEVFQEKVAKQAFPLHPLTTALLSSVDLEKSTSVRSVLNFVLDEDGGVRTHFEEPAQLDGGRPNWVLPTLLVDYFGEMLDEDKYKNFKNVFKPDLGDEQKAVLKAMLLIDIAELATRDVGYEVTVAEMAGLSEAVATRTLKALEAEHYIRRDNANKTYSFWVGSNGAMELDRQLRENLALREQRGTLHTLFSTYTAQSNAVNDLGLTTCHEVAVDWGNPTDWAAQEVLLPFSALKPTVLDALSAQYAVPLEKGPKARGVVVLVVPSTQAEADAAPAKIREMFSVSSKYETAPMLFVCPREPHAELTGTLHRLAVLNDPVFKSAHELKVGGVVYEEMAGRLHEQAGGMLERIRRSGDLVVPPAISGGLAAKNVTAATANRLGTALGVVYAAAYSKHPDRFFTQYKLSGSNLNKAVVDLIHELIDNSLDAVQWPANASIQKDLVQMLRDHWGIINPRKQVVEPQHSRIKEAWARLDATFAPRAGKISPAEVLKELLHPPYGYDQNTLALLFAAWIGKNRTAIKLGGIGSLGRMANTKGQTQSPFKKPADFLKAMSAIEISRKDMGQELAKVTAVLSELEAGPLTQVEAKRGRLALEEFKTNNPRYDSEYLEILDRAAGKLRQGLDNLDAYDKAVGDFEIRLSRANTVDAAVPLMGTLTKLPPLTVVVSEKPGVDELRSQLTRRILQAVEQQAAEFSKLPDLGKFALREQQLKALLSVLKPLNLTEANDRIQQALQELKAAKDRLEGAQAAEQEVSIVRSIPTKGNLASLRDSLKSLQKLDPKSDQAAELAEEKYTQIKATIGELEAHLRELPSVLDGVVDASAAKKLHQQLLQESYQYQGTPEAERMANATDRAGQLEAYLESLSSWRPPSSPQEAEHIRARLSALEGQYAQVLAPSQQALLAGALSTLDAQVEKGEAEALAWLAERRTKLEGGAAPAALARELETPPAFLPEASRPALDALRDALRSQLDAAAQEKGALERIRAVPETGSVAKLRERLAEVEGWPTLTPATAEASLAKQQRLKEELHRLEALPAEWNTQMEDVLTAHAAGKLHADIIRQETRYHGSEWEERVHAVAARAKQIEEVLREVENLRGRRDANLRDLAEKRKVLEALLPHAALGERQRTRIEQDVQDCQRQTDERLARFAADLEQQARALAAATTVRAVQAVDLGRFPHSWLPVQLQDQLQTLEAQRQALQPVLQELESLGTTSLRDLGQAHSVLQQLGGLITHPALSPAQQTHAEALRQKMLEGVKAKRQEALSWLEQQIAKLEALSPEDGAGLARVQQALRTPSPFLDGQATQRLQALQQDVERRLEENEVLQIEVLFSRITSPERRQACLERLRQLSGLTLA
ncbi:hypothetical protein SAMN04488058_13214 [Deinococcus reticulitermitis]|uniref:Uncharacterized protein n=1 Tax=Deinococcus reticulitermitis TaxID=856736 RepID=A0A1H7CL70_9DEIO|nr:hypothetical protein [Deinococcus reticulitermitis]SEJ90361.1 hypothetical protein SAMN04488058_13214 [Deinococcus reticulitermitis]